MMTTALLIMTSAAMLNFNHGIPSPLLDETWRATGGQQVIQAIDERYLNEEWRIYGGNLAIGLQVIFQQKLVLKAEF
jgi:hypothetical protein